MRRLLALAAIVPILLAPASAHAMDITAPAGWCWFQDPRAIEFNERVVFGWVDGEGDIMVGDDAGRRFRLHPRLQRDDHDNPAFYIRKDGRLMAFWTAHHGDRVFYRTARNLRSWGPVKNGPPNPPGGRGYFTYPNPRRYQGKLHLFWSGLENTATYATSLDDGDSWSPSLNLFKLGEPVVRYIKYDVGRDGIHMAWTLSHPRDMRSGIFHAVLRDGRLWKQDGTLIGKPPVSPSAGDVVYPPGWGWIHDIAVKNGRPYIAYATFPSLDNHRYRYAYWKHGWHNRTVTDAGPAFPEQPPKEEQYSGGISLDQRNPYRLYLSRKVGGSFEIERWTRTRGRWSHRAVTAGSSVLNVRPFSVGGGVAWMRGRYPNAVDWQTTLTWRR